jgi:flagellar FliL protein
MAKKEEAHGEGHAEEAPKPKGKKKLLIIVTVVMLLLGGGAAFFLLGGKKEEPKKEEEEHVEEVHHYKTAELEPFIVNLSENNRFLKTTILLEYDPKALEATGEHGSGGEESGGHGSGGGEEGGGGKGGLPEAMAGRLPMIRDAIIRVLSSKKVEEVLSGDGKEKLKEDLIESCNEAIGIEGAVVGVYFTEFIVQ